MSFVELKKILLSYQEYIIKRILKIMFHSLMILINNQELTLIQINSHLIKSTHQEEPIPEENQYCHKIL